MTVVHPIIAFSRYWQRVPRSSELMQIALAALCGAVVGIAIALIGRGVELLHQWCFALPSGMRLSTGLGIGSGRLLLVPVCGGLLLGLGGLLVRRCKRHRAEIVDPVEANALHGGRMNMTDSLRLLVSTVLSNASGASVGMEAGYSQCGAGVFSAFGQFSRLRRADLRIFVAAGTAAAIGAAYNAPLAGAFYGFELILGSYSVRALAPVMAASLAGVLAERALIPPEPTFLVGAVAHISPWHYGLFACVGVLAAGLSIVAMQAVKWAEQGFHAIPLPGYLRPALGGALLSVMALFLPQVLGSGHGAIQFHFDNAWPLWPLIFLLVAKLIASALSIGAGFRGGLFSSSLFLGCLFGAVLADAMTLVFPQAAGLHTMLMMVGMGSVAAGIIGAPLTMVFLVLEGTGDFFMTGGVMAGAVVASTLVRLRFGYSFSTWRFHLRGLKIRSPNDVGWLKDMTAAKLMRADAVCIAAETGVAVARRRFPPGSAKRLFVVAADGRYGGMLDVSALHEMGGWSDAASVTAGALAVGADVYLLASDDIKTALSRFESCRLETLPVMADADARQILGYITEAYALRRYSQMLEMRHSAELGQSDLYSSFRP